MRLGALAAAAALSLVAADAVVAQSASAFVEARRAGIIGERYDGYVGFVTAPPAALRRQVAGINIRRRSIYTSLAVRRGVTPKLAGIAAGCALLSRISLGEAYLLSDGKWRRRMPGQPPPSPPHCNPK
jgi:uncharacterized protein YdbL (DUF1318 family)